MATELHSYEEIPVLTAFSDIFTSDEYYRVPPNWYVIITDVINSTAAIEEGRYKDVNTAGSIAAMAISNIKKDMNFPFIFGGDGMSYLVPDAMLPQVKEVLLDTRDLVSKVFGLVLRLGVVPVRHIYDQGYAVEVARLKVSDRYVQAIIRGAGMDYAERLIKSDERFLLPGHAPAKQKADYSGFTCRWEDIPSRKGETIALIVKAAQKGQTGQRTTLATVLSRLEEILGQEKPYAPLHKDGFSMSPKEAQREARVFSRTEGGLFFNILKLSIKIQMLMVGLILKLNLPFKAGWKPLNNVKQDNIINADFRKFDGSLKMVLSCNSKERERLVRFLDTLESEGRLFYGIHVSDRALMTCLIHTRTANEVHFVDAADGGYAYAAKVLKRKLAAAE